MQMAQRTVVMMTKELYNASVAGNVGFLTNQLDDTLRMSRSANEGNSILHIALDPASREQREFVKRILERVPELLYETNNHGETPVHVAARSTTLCAFDLLRFCKENFIPDTSTNAKLLPWRVQNLKGNTPLHEALHSGNAVFARLLIHIDDEVAHYVNNDKETPLHFVARYRQAIITRVRNEVRAEWADNTMGLIEVDELQLLLDAYGSAAFLKDVDGLTPLLRAAQTCQINKVRTILARFPRSRESRDLEGRTFLHIIRLNTEEEAQIFLQMPVVRDLATVEDFEGNTPLHSATKKGHYFTIRALASRDFYKRALQIKNYDGQLPFDLIKSKAKAPIEMRRLLRPKSSELVSKKKWALVSNLKDLSEPELRSHLNLLAVVAVLLATITFVAAYSVPGGFDSNTGAPNLLRKGRYKVFIILATYTVSCSMLVLLSLILVMQGELSESLTMINNDHLLRMVSAASILCKYCDLCDRDLSTIPDGPRWLIVVLWVLDIGLMVLALLPFIPFRRICSGLAKKFGCTSNHQAPNTTDQGDQDPNDPNPGP